MVVLAWRGPSSATKADATGTAVDAQRLVGILQYLQTDYPAAVASKDAAELAEQRSLSAEAVDEETRLPALQAFAPRIASIDLRVREARDPDGVATDCAALVDDLVTAAGIGRAPREVPDLHQGARFFADNCASCHGATGHGDGVAAAALKPPPVDFQSPEVMATLTPFKAFNVIRFGVRGTAMAAFASLDERDRWALAFYVFSLRQPVCDHVPPRATLDQLANQTDEGLAKSVGPAEVACLRDRLPELDAHALIASARAKVDEARRRAIAGDPGGAEPMVLDAYLGDIEPVEPRLRAANPELVTQIEDAFTLARADLRAHAPTATERLNRLSGLLEEAQNGRRDLSSGSAFGMSLLVVVREGFEASIVVAALLAVVKRRKQLSRARWVHAGWLSALAVGGAAFFLGRAALAGAMNEKLEGCLAFVAAAMLLHAALWLNSKATTRHAMGELRDRTGGALDRGALALFAIAFLAMFRETFETAVFLEALSLDAPMAVVWGAGAGTLLLLSLVYAVGRLGLRLPMTKLFTVSTWLLVATAVVLVGQGVHSFEEVGLIASSPMRFVRLDFFGIYADRASVLAQVVVIAGPLAWLGVKALQSRRPSGTTPEPDAGE